MRLRDVFLISVYVLFALATLLLVVGEGSAFPQAVGFPLSVIALVLIDGRRQLRVPAWALNIAATLSVAAAAWEFVGESPESRLTAAAHLLVYLGWVVLLGGKANRQYWWLLTLSVLQVAVGAVLVEASGEPLYSLLMVLFMVTATWTLSVFSLQQVQGRLAAVPVAVQVPDGPDWLRPTAAGSGCQLDADQQWINSRFVLGVAAAAVGALFVAALFFLLIPRLWLFDPSGQDDAQNDPLRPLTGFTETVQLGEIGDILESTMHVMSVEVIDRQTGDRIEVDDLARAWGDTEPLFRGTVMVRYSRGKWERGLGDSRFNRMRGVPQGLDGIRQDIQLETLGTPVLFGMHPVNGCVIDSASRYGLFHPSTGVLVGARDRGRGRVLRYSLFSPSPNSAAGQRPRVPSVMSPAERLEYLQLPPRDLDRLSRTARRLVSTRSGATDTGKADRLMEFLSGDQFGYSLDASVSDATLDPVEDFVFERRRGHCEYFASSLALMLRAVGIPSRLVSGFKGGTHNQISGQFVVQQRHAHAWVEAWIGSRWVTLDPTPGGREELIRRLEANSGFLRDAGQVMEHSWRRYVVELSLAQQQSLVYLPLQAGLLDTMTFFNTLVTDALEAVGGLAAGRGAGDRWPALLAVIGLVGLLAVAVWVLRRWRSGWRPRVRRRGRAGRTAAVVVPFYERFCRMLAASGRLRRRGQTAREFATDMEETSVESPDGGGLGPIAGEVTELYYSIRFGGHRPEAEVIAGAERDLDRLEAALRADRTNG
jgi:hypothetical protein